MRRYIAEPRGRAEQAGRHGDAGRETCLAGRVAPSGPSFSWLRRLTLSCLLALASAGPAAAGAWVQEKGGAYLRASLALEDHGGPDAKRTDLYAEYGITSLWTVSAKYETVDFDDSDAFDSDGWRVSARRKLWSGRGFVTSAEAGLLEGAALGGFRGCESRGLEIGLGAGYGGVLAGTDVFAGAVLSRREHEDDCFHDRLELVAGYSTDGLWFWTAQLWSERGDTDKSDKTELMLSRRIGRAEIGLAVRREVSGAFDETATVLSLAFRPSFQTRLLPN